MLIHRSFPLVLAAAVATTTVVAHAQGAPCFEANFGTDLQLGDDTVAGGLALGFAFPFAAGSVSAITVSSNGFVWLGAGTASACCNGDVGQLLANAPRIAPLWVDLNPAAAGSVHFNALPGRAVITWNQVVEFGQAASFTVQLQLLADGSFVVFFDPAVGIVGHTALLGVSPGGGAVDPGAIDFASALPFDSGTRPTIYESFGPGAFDLAGVGMTFTPNGNGGYTVTRRSDCDFASFVGRGVGCPSSPSAYEFFDVGNVDLSGLAFEFSPAVGGGYDIAACAQNCFDTGYASGTNLALSDDSVARNLALGFSFPFHGGSTTAIDVSSNGCVYLEPGLIGGHRCCAGDPAAFLADPASIALFWLDLNPAGGGGVYTHRPSPTSFVVTFAAVPEYQAAGSANTAQLQLHADGRFRLAFGNVANAGHAALVGFTPGNGAGDPGSIDLSTAVPFSTGSGGSPLGLSASAGTRPTLGSTFSMVVGEAPGSANALFLLLGFNEVPGGASLAGLGMPGCRLHLGIDLAVAFPLQGAYSVTSLTIPNNPALTGGALHAQALVVAPGVNAFGAITSNAARLEFGL
ncbi:MAG: hypothetical protein IT457_17980 [Planctomycetes bacterium]|nr:hypothetical protein [Planctomycetota bacterium]